MNFDDAIRAHTAWKFKLEAYLRKPDHSINSAELQRDNQCELGRWIYSQTDAHASDAILVELKKDHADFHRIAASLVERANAGEKVSGEVALCGTSPYSACTTRIVTALIKMRAASATTVSR